MEGGWGHRGGLVVVHALSSVLCLEDVEVKADVSP